MRIYLNCILLTMVLFVIRRWIPYSQNYPIKLLPISPEATLLLGSVFINIRQSHYYFSTLLKKLSNNFLNVCLHFIAICLHLKLFVYIFWSEEFINDRVQSSQQSPFCLVDCNVAGAHHLRSGGCRWLFAHKLLPWTFWKTNPLKSISFKILQTNQSS